MDLHGQTPAGRSAPLPGPIEQQALGDQVADALRYMIAARHYAAGTRLVEVTLADQFAVSRGPIRDALKTLESEGLIRSSRRGTFVQGFSRRDIDELYSLRAAMEQLAVRLLVERRDEVDWAPFELFLAAMREAARTEDNAAFSQADVGFHSAVYDQADHRRLRDVWRSYQKTIAVVLEQSGEHGMDIDDAVADHQALLDAFQNADPETAAACVAGHLEAAHTRIRAVFPDEAEPVTTTS